MSKFSEAIESTTDELKNKVTWPTWQELQSSTVLVMIATLILSVVIGIIDLVGSQLINLLYQLA